MHGEKCGRGLAWSLYNGTTWSAFENLTIGAVSGPSCTTDNNGGIICEAYSTGYQSAVNRFTGGAWEGFLNFGGTFSGEPNCIFWQPTGQVVCTGKGTTNQIYPTAFNGGSWNASNWSETNLGSGGVFNDNANCATQAAGQLVCAAIGFDNALHANVYNGSNWSGWADIGGTGVGTPSCTSLGTGQVVCVVMGIDNELTSVVGP